MQRGASVKLTFQKIVLVGRRRRENKEELGPHLAYLNPRSIFRAKKGPKAE